LGPVISPVNGHSYYLLSAASWTVSQAEAIALGGHLATVRNAAENQWLVETFSAESSRHLWIGLTDAIEEGRFEWIGGEPVSFANWGLGEPNQIGGLTNEDFVAIVGYSFNLLVRGDWNDVNDLDWIAGPIHAVVEVVASGCAADFNRSGDVTVQDIFDFLATWQLRLPAADFNGIDGVTVQDIFDFLAAWNNGGAGCP
jgi:hypothetical protein